MLCRTVRCSTRVDLPYSLTLDLPDKTNAQGYFGPTVVNEQEKLNNTDFGTGWIRKKNVTTISCPVRTRARVFQTTLAYRGCKF